MVSVTDNWAKVEAKMFTIEFGSLVTIKKIAYLNQAINYILHLHDCCFEHTLFQFYPWFVCCPGGSECDHAWKWSVVDVTDKQK